MNVILRSLGFLEGERSRTMNRKIIIASINHQRLSTCQRYREEQCPQMHLPFFSTNRYFFVIVVNVMEDISNILEKMLSSNELA